MANLDTTGQLLEYKVVDKKTQQGIPYTSHDFLFLIESGVTEVNVSNKEYIEKLVANFGCTTMAELADKLKEMGDQVKLYFVNSENFIGFSLMQGFKKNNFPNPIGAKVLITNVEADQSGVLFELEDGTVGNRNFSRQIGADAQGKGGQWYPDVQKKIRFIKDIKGLDADPTTFDLNTLVGWRVDYAISKAGTNEYFEPMKVYPPENLAGADLLNQF